MKTMSRIRKRMVGTSMSQSRPARVRCTLPRSSLRAMTACLPRSGVAERLAGVGVTDRPGLVPERSADDVDAVLVDQGLRWSRGGWYDDRLGVSAAAMVDRHDLTVVRGVLVGARAEGLPERAGQRDEEPAGGARRRCSPGDRRFRPAVAGVPAFDRVDPAAEGQAARPTETELEGDGGGVLVVGREERGGQPDVIGLRRQQVADAEVTGPQSFAPRHPWGREQSLVTGQQDDLVDGGDLGAWRPAERDRPPPSAVGGVERGEVVGADAVAVAVNAE